MTHIHKFIAPLIVAASLAVILIGLHIWSGQPASFQPAALAATSTDNDSDNDGKKDSADHDDDRDGLTDKAEAKQNRKNHDNDDDKDKKDNVDADDDADGIKDWEEATCAMIYDNDNDGTAADMITTTDSGTTITVVENAMASAGIIGDTGEGANYCNPPVLLDENLYTASQCGYTVDANGVISGSLYDTAYYPNGDFSDENLSHSHNDDWLMVPTTCPAYSECEPPAAAVPPTA